MLTCACGTRFEVDDALAGQEVLCPECRQPLQAPAAARPPLVTSGWALASVLLALIGAFTVVGTVAAVIVGLIALVSIARQRDRVTGTGFAIAGICLGFLFTVLTLVALNATDVLGLETWMRQRYLAKKIDTTGPLEVVHGASGFAITRPTEKWGQVPDNQSGDPAVGEFQNNLDLLLIHLPRHAFVDVRVLPGGPLQTLDACEAEVFADFETRRPLGQARDPFDDDDDFRPTVRVKRLGSQRLTPADGVQGRQTEAEVRRAGKTWHFIIRLYRRANGRIYVVRAYAPVRRFDAIRSELEAALDSFRILRR